MARNRSIAVIFALTCSTLWLPVVFAQEAEWSGNINLFGGQKSLNNDDWSDEAVDVSKQNEFGIRIDFKQVEWPVSIAIDYLSSSVDDSASVTLFDPLFGTVVVSEDVKGETSVLYCKGVTYEKRCHL